MQLLPEGKTRRALLNVACEVLFIQDPERHDLYHPRIAAQLTHLYTTLSDQHYNYTPCKERVCCPVLKI